MALFLLLEGLLPGCNPATKSSALLLPVLSRSLPLGYPFCLLRLSANLHRIDSSSVYHAVQALSARAADSNCLQDAHPACYMAQIVVYRVPNALIKNLQKGFVCARRAHACLSLDVQPCHEPERHYSSDTLAASRPLDPQT